VKNHCEFLKLEQHGPRCMAGVNFAAVGPDRALCRVCSMADLGDVLKCEHLDVYTWQRTDEAGAPQIESGVRCALGDRASDDQARCERCPAHRGK